jgi:hypothetical protein
MKTRSLVIFAAGILVGSVCTLLWLPNGKPEYSQAASVAPTKHFAADHKLAADSTKVAVSKAANTLVSEEISISDAASDDVRLPVVESLKADCQSRLDARLSELTTLLNLDEEQAAKAGEFLTECFPPVYEPGIYALLDEEERLATGIPAEAVFGGHFRARGEKLLAKLLADILSPGQTEQFHATATAARTNAIESSIYRELSGMQSQFTLTPEQKDATFHVLTQIAEKEYDAQEPDVGIFAHRREQRLAAMRPILSQEQLIAYEKTIGGSSYEIHTEQASDQGTSGTSVFINPEAY